MKYSLALLALLAAVEASPVPQGVTQNISPDAPAPSGCKPSWSGKFGIMNVNVTSTSSAPPAAQGSDGQPTGSTQAADGQTQSGGATQISDGQPQAGTGATQISDGQPQAGTGATQIADGQPQAGTGATQIADGQPQAGTGATQIADGQPQAGTGATQIADGQPQAGTGATQIADGQPQAGTGATQIADGQPQAGTGATQISDGQPQAGTGASQISDGQPQAGSGASQAGDGQTQSGGGSSSGSSSGSSTGAKMNICQKDNTLTLTLDGGVLKDGQGRTGYIASNYQFQFDAPAQAGAIYTSGFSVCENGTLALGGSSIFWQCRSGDFYNLYDRKWAEQCNPVYLQTGALVPCK